MRDPHPLADSLPRDRVNILLVTARPYEGDVRFRSISRPLVELIERHRLPAEVTVLRPPTFDALREHLRERPGHYHRRFSPSRRNRVIVTRRTGRGTDSLLRVVLPANSRGTRPPLEPNCKVGREKRSTSHAA